MFVRPGGPYLGGFLFGDLQLISPKDLARGQSHSILSFFSVQNLVFDEIYP